jgi:hypothetical protein
LVTPVKVANCEEALAAAVGIELDERVLAGDLDGEEAAGEGIAGVKAEEALVRSAERNAPSRLKGSATHERLRGNSWVPREGRDGEGSTSAG